MVSNVQIDAVLNTLANYGGCFSLDEIHLIKPAAFKGTSSFVLNTFESTYRSGGHWVLLTFFNSGSRVEVFDSVGTPSLIPKKIKVALAAFDNVQYTTNTLQNPFSNYCGFYVMGRCVSIYNGQSLKKFISNFGSSVNANDRAIKEQVLQYINEQMDES